ncbi:nucleotidyltransferase domain-containing protein [Marispirochaeta sp.]|uniref:nucleotidyltransferase family protein n=1 Tax=Marispirochaeta sp. TaxID=2038653 RepID=UPI0029C8CF95|nr:nucleotidyltransferase domain-containing protein [Marispirochaeta sp.]
MDLKNIDKRFRSDVDRAIEYLKTAGCTEIYVFGSLSSGTVHSKSDIDIAVKGLRAEDYFSVYGELISMLDHSIDLVDLELQPAFAKILIETEQLLQVA